MVDCNDIIHWCQVDKFDHISNFVLKCWNVKSEFEKPYLLEKLLLYMIPIWEHDDVVYSYDIVHVWNSLLGAWTYNAQTFQCQMLLRCNLMNMWIHPIEFTRSICENATLLNHIFYIIVIRHLIFFFQCFWVVSACCNVNNISLIPTHLAYSNEFCR